MNYDNLLNLKTINNLAEKILGKDKAKNWMNTKVSNLGDRTPTDVVLNDSDGFDKVKSTLNQIKHSIY